MKKTIIALFALAGMASALDSLTLDNAVAAFLVQNGSITSVMGDFTLTGNNLTLNNGANWGADIFYDASNPSKKRTELTVALTVDMAKLATLEEAAKLISLNSWGVGAVPTTDAVRISGTWGSNADYYHTDPFEATGYRDFVVTLSNSGTRIFNGSTASFYSNNGLKGDTNSTALVLSDTLLSGAVLKAVVWSDGAYEGQGSEKVASAFAALVQAPEPATATLSLLALAGLASRRRRH